MGLAFQFSGSDLDDWLFFYNASQHVYNCSWRQQTIEGARKIWNGQLHCITMRSISEQVVLDTHKFPISYSVIEGGACTRKNGDAS